VIVVCYGASMNKVKGQRGGVGNGFDKHSENINREGGPPKELTYAQLIEDAANEQSKYDATKTRKTRSIDQQWDKAEQGDLASFNSLVDRSEGKPYQRSEVDITSLGEKITKITVELVSAPQASIS